MVTVRRAHELESAGYADLTDWLASVAERCRMADTDELELACIRAEDCEHAAERNGQSWPYGLGCFRMGLEIAETLAELRADGQALPAAVLYRAVREGHLSLDEVTSDFGPDTARLIEGVLRMAAISRVMTPSRNVVLGQSGDQLDNLRRMLVAMIDDVRVALVKLAERTVVIRAVKDAREERRRKVAREVFDIYAPLAHRLGVGHLKWELEDLAFRYLEPDPYKKIAGLLAEKRLDRERYIEEVVDELQRQLERAGIDGARVEGRAKHIHSIWRKMQRKQLDFNDVYDVRAVRIQVPETRDCYAVLGIVHSLWQHLPHEFDDYIASPKDNGYRSLHTAVVGPERKMLEVQIRTFAMHEEAELGVCAHWRYKEGEPDERARAYDSKIAWLRQVLEWHDELGETGLVSIMDEFNPARDNEHIYVFTPEGHVVDLEAGATPVDFAYQVHTEVGHACRGARVNGRIVPLHYQLRTGEQVEVLTASEPAPKRDWLNPALGYVQTSYAHARIHQWFKRRDRDEHIQLGRSILERETRRLALEPVDPARLAPALALNHGEDVLVALGSGDLRAGDVIQLAQEVQRPDERQQQLSFAPDAPGGTEAEKDGDEHAETLVTHVAACCQPVPGDLIMGYITKGRGVTVHRASCQQLLTRQAENPDRVIEVNWNQSDRITYPVDIHVRGPDRTGLLRDLLSVLTGDGINITAVDTHSHDQDASVTMLLTIEIDNLGNLGDVLARMEQISEKLEVRRYKK
jgi:GTP pyrophosphokinase